MSRDDREWLQFAIVILTFLLSAATAYRVADISRMVADIYTRLHGLGLGG
jgi:hypothetical protein